MVTLTPEGGFLPTKMMKNEFSYFDYLEYYPAKFSVSEELYVWRRVIWEFKDGYVEQSMYLHKDSLTIWSAYN